MGAVSSATFYAPVEGELKELERRLLAVGRGGHPTFQAAVEHVFQTPGKLLRPTLVFLSARFGTRDDRETVLNLAQSLELVHTASLVHDDIVDRADVRRNIPTVNAMWDGDVALIVGDYLFAKAYALAAVLPKPEVIAIVAQTVFALCDGELNEVTSPPAMPTEAEYLERIELKTASLYAACCQGAALLTEADPEHVAALGAFGTNLGLAFQMTDDILDLVGDEAEFGKAVGRDLQEGMAGEGPRCRHEGGLRRPASADRHGPGALGRRGRRPAPHHGPVFSPALTDTSGTRGDPDRRRTAHSRSGEGGSGGADGRG